MFLGESRPSSLFRSSRATVLNGESGWRSGTDFASEIRAAGEHALTLLEGGLGDYGSRRDTAR